MKKIGKDQRCKSSLPDQGSGKPTRGAEDQECFWR